MQEAESIDMPVLVNALTSVFLCDDKCKLLARAGFGLGTELWHSYLRILAIINKCCGMIF